MKSLRPAVFSVLSAAALLLDMGFPENARADHSCLLFVKGIHVYKTDEAFVQNNHITFTLAGDATIIEAGMMVKKVPGNGTPEWVAIQATAEGKNWNIEVTFPTSFNFSFVDGYFYAKNARGGTLYLNKDGIPFQNFRLDLSLFYELYGYSQDLKSENIDLTQADLMPEAAKQFNPFSCK